MSLDGLRAWIGEVERKLGVRTRVFLVLTAIAIGGAGAAIYLALDAQSNRVSQGDLQAVQEELQAQIGAVGEQTPEAGGTGGDPRVPALQREVQALRAQLESLEEAGEPGSSEGGTSGGSAGGEGESGGQAQEPGK